MKKKIFLYPLLISLFVICSFPFWYTLFIMSIMISDSGTKESIFKSNLVMALIACIVIFKIFCLVKVWISFKKNLYILMVKWNIPIVIISAIGAGLILGAFNTNSPQLLYILASSMGWILLGFSLVRSLR